VTSFDVPSSYFLFAPLLESVFWRHHHLITSVLGNINNAFRTKLRRLRALIAESASDHKEKEASRDLYITFVLIRPLPTRIANMLTFDDALSTLMAMFGPQWSKENLDLVLRHFDGHMENTVDTILANGDKRPQDLIEQLNKAQVGFDLDEQLAQELGREEARLQRATGVPPPALRRDPGSDRPRSHGTAMPSESRPKVELPHDFLRIPGYPHSDMSSSTVADDEALARALQNELFMNQIRDDPELSHLSRPRYSSMTTTPGLASRPGNPFAFPNRPTAATGGQDGHGFLDALSGKLLLTSVHG
jgi:hypothetical protein